MNDPAGDPQNRQHSLRDWLALHELDSVTCSDILRTMTWDAAREPAAGKKLKSGYQAPDIEGAWLRTAEAMCAFLHEQQSIIHDTLDKTAKILVDRREKSRKALTLDNGPDAYPTILYSYRGEPSDSLVIAHEFGHALQIRASRGKFVPPIMREVCAFLGEAAMLSHTLNRSKAQYAYLGQAWRKDNRRYFGVQRDRLQTALLRPDTPYSYSWNYPIARYLAIELSERCFRDWIWGVFEGKLTVPGVLQKLALSRSKWDT
jgi:hypothetical protein